jgi:hypothetical protein
MPLKPLEDLTSVRCAHAGKGYVGQKRTSKDDVPLAKDQDSADNGAHCCLPLPAPLDD